MPPRIVNDGAPRIAAASSRSNSDSDGGIGVVGHEPPDRVEHVLLKARAQLLDERRLGRRRLAGVEQARDRQRQRANPPPAGDGLAQRRLRALVASAVLAQVLLDHQVGGQPALGPARSKDSSEVFCAQPAPTSPSDELVRRRTPRRGSTSLKNSLPSR